MPDILTPTCPNCGAPLTIDRNGLCSFCCARVAHASAPFADLPQPARGILRIAAALEGEPAAIKVIASLGAADSVRSVLDAVAVSAQRVIDGGFMLDGQRVDVSSYTAEEMWTFNLAADVVALLAAAPNLPKTKRTAVRVVLATVDAGLGTHASRSRMGNAGSGPAAFYQLREAVPHRSLIRP